MKKFIFILLFMCIISPCFAATQLLKTVKPSGGDYTSLEACMNANEQNLVTADKYFDVEIDGTWSSADTTAVTIHNYTTDATRYINIYTTSAARHLGVWSTSYYMLSLSNTGSVITNSISNVFLTGLQLRNEDVSGNYNCYTPSGLNLYVIKCILRSSRFTLAFNSGNAGNCYVINSIIYTLAASLRDAVDNQGPFVTLYIYSSTLIGGRYGLNKSSTGTIIAKNCYASGGTASYNGTITMTTCASADTTGDLDNIAYSTVNFTNVTAGTENLHLPLGSGLIDQGTNTSGESAPLNFTDDIDGVTRSGTWDIGADEFVAAGVARRIWTF